MMQSFNAFRRMATGVLALLLAPLASPVQAESASAPAPAQAQPGPVGAPLTKADIDAWLDGYLPYALRRGDVAGAVVVVVKDDQVLTQRGFGYADVARRTPIDPEITLFRQASVSKLFTWTAVMQLVEQGKIDLDRDVNAYLDFHIPPRDGKPVTMRNLMTHTAGFEDAQRGLNSYNPKVIPPLGEALKRWVPQRIFAPGTTPGYSNYGAALAGYIVERVSGMPFALYMERHVFAPAGMTHSSFRQPLPASMRPLVASGYKLASSGKPSAFELTSLPPAGALTASGADMGRFMIAQLDNGGALLKPATAQMMHGTTLTLLPPLNRMALGFYEQNINGRAVIAHAGDTITFHSNVLLFLNERVGVYISMNGAGAGGVTGVIRSHLLDGFADRYFPAPQRDGRVDAATAKAHVQMMLGTYNKTRRSESSFLKALELLGGQATVSRDASGGIRLSVSPGLSGQPRQWVEIAPFVWRDEASKMRLAAKVENGKVVRFGVDSASPYLMFDRVPWYSSTAWITPALLISLGALLLTALAWPATAIARRIYRAPALAVAERRRHRLVRGFAGLSIAVLAGWVAFGSALLGDFSRLSGELDWALIALQVATPLVFVGLAGLAAWNLWAVWQAGRGWFAKLWSVALVLAGLLLLWVGVVFHLIGFGLNF